ncbi:hypothetical protein V2J09_022384 [Rumex salicifolius]
MTPFEGVYGRKPPGIQQHLPGESVVASVVEEFWNRDEILLQLKFNLDLESLSGQGKACHKVLIVWEGKPLEEATWMSCEDFKAQFASSNLADKVCSMEGGIVSTHGQESFISGIGNWIADEARIHPMQSASSLSKESCAVLLKCISEVIEKSVEVGADDSKFPSNWIFHSREKKLGKAFVDGLPSIILIYGSLNHYPAPVFKVCSPIAEIVFQ